MTLTTMTTPPGTAEQVLQSTPVVRLDLAAVGSAYRTLRLALPGVALHHAVTANPARPVLEILAREGGSWDVAGLAR